MASEWVPIKEAAERLGISADTVRRRLKRGELTGRQEPTAQGFVWVVELPPLEPGQGEASASLELQAAAPTAQAVIGEALELAELRERVSGLERLTSELKEERDEWREQARRHEDAARELRILVRNAQELARALPATTGDGGGEDAAEMVPASPQSPQGGEEAAPRPGLWDRLVRRLGGA